MFNTKHFQPIITTIMCIVIINVLAPHAFNPKSQYSYFYLIKFHDFVDNNQDGMKLQMKGVIQAQQVMTL